MTAAFTPIRDDGRAAWRVVYDLILGRNLGDLITHDEFLAELESDERDAGYYSTIQKAIKHLQRDHRRSLETVRGTGYRVIAGHEQVRKARGQQQRGHTALVRATETATTVDATGMSPGQVAGLRQVTNGLAALAGYTARLAEDVDRHEAEIIDLRRRADENTAWKRATEEQLAELRQRLGLKE